LGGEKETLEELVSNGHVPAEAEMVERRRGACESRKRIHR